MNVLFLMSDDLRPELGAYYGPNYPSPVHPPMHTPNIDALASRSLLLKRAYAQQAICSPSRASLLTGRRPDTTRVYDLDHYFREVGGNFTTLPQYFKNHGYKSIGIGKIFHPGKASGHDDPVSWSVPYFRGTSNFENTGKSWYAVPDNLLVTKPLQDKQIADHAKQTLQRIAQDAKSGKKNFFMAVGFHKPHLPFVFPKSFMDKYYPTSSIHLPPNPYAPRHMPDVAWFGFNGFRHEYSDIRVANASGAINTTFPDHLVLELRRAYYSAVSWMDSLVGEVVAELDKQGLSQNTIVVFTSDHGWQLGEHGLWCKHTNFELATHAPLMIHIPNLTDAGIETDQLVEYVDIYPTVVEAAGLGTLRQCNMVSTFSRHCREGMSILPLINNPTTPLKKAAFSQYPRRGKHVMGYTIRTDKYRYTEWAAFNFTNPSGPNWQHLSGVELYDHSIDPEENINRANYAAYHSARVELQKLLHGGWMNAQADSFHGTPQLIG